MKAIFVTGGKQYYVSEGDTIYVEKLDKEVGSEITFTDVLYVDGKAGTPYVDGAKVVCSVEKGKVYYVRNNVSSSLKFVFFIPNFKSIRIF